MPLLDEPQLTPLGWDTWFEARFWMFQDEGLVPARVCADFGAELEVRDGNERLRAVLSSRLRSEDTHAAVGDWVALEYRGGVSVIHHVIERRTSFARQAAGTETRQQVLAANIDVVFVVVSAQDVNARRVERYLTMASRSGASPVVVLTKADIAGSVDEVRFELEGSAAGAPVVVTSSVTGDGLADVGAHLVPTRTGVLLGPSGAGKSSLINRLVGNEVMRTRDVHRSGEGRHMTSHRQLVELPRGGLIIDTPGLREAQLWAGDDAIDTVFEDVESLAAQCRFPDCRHDSEPGCAVKAALEDGTLDAARLTSYRKLQRELRSIAARSDMRLRQDERRKWKQIAVANKVRDRLMRQ